MLNSLLSFFDMHFWVGGAVGAALGVLSPFGVRKAAQDVKDTAAKVEKAISDRL